MAAHAPRPREEQDPATFFLDAQGVVVVTQVSIERRIRLHQRGHLKRRDRRRGVDKRQTRRRHARIGGAEEGDVFRDGEQALHHRAPDLSRLAIWELRQLVGIAEHVDVAQATAHFAPIQDRHHGLCGNHVRQPGRQGDFGQRRTTAAEPAVPEDVEQADRAVEQGGCVPGHEAASRTQGAGGPAPATTGADRERQTVGHVHRRLVTRRARDVAVTAQDLVEHQRPAKRHERRILLRRRGNRHHPPRTDAAPQLRIERFRKTRRRRLVARRGQHKCGDTQRSDGNSHLAPPRRLNAAAATARFDAWTYSRRSDSADHSARRGSRHPQVRNHESC